MLTMEMNLEGDTPREEQLFVLFDFLAAIKLVTAVHY